MTDPRGQHFISYRRSPGRRNGTQEAVRMRDALRDRGIPTWRDIDDLSSEPTEGELVSVIEDADTAGAILLVSPEVSESPLIRNVEARRIFRRHQNDNSFLVNLVSIGLDYAEVNDVLGAPAGLQDLRDWNLHKVEGDCLTDDDARAIARAVVKSRLSLIAEDDPEAPLNIAVYSRRGGGRGPYDLRHDFSPYFSGRKLRHVDAYRIIGQALVDTCSVLCSTRNRTAIRGQGNASLPLGVLYGAVFSPLAGFNVSWVQALAGQRQEIWSLSCEQSAIRLKTDKIMADASSEDIVLALSISADIQSAVAEFINNNGFRPRASIHATLEDGSVPQGMPLSPEDGVAIVLQAVQAARELKDDLGISRARIHLFLACPLAMAVLLGQKLNTFSQCVLYEHHPDLTPSYRRVHVFSPSNFD